MNERDVQAVVAILDAHCPMERAPSICGCGQAFLSPAGQRRHVAEVIVTVVGDPRSV